MTDRKWIAFPRGTPYSIVSGFDHIPPNSDLAPITPAKPTLTDEEREAVEYAAMCFGEWPQEQADVDAAATLRKLLERLKGPTRATS